jgi:hypothetical protein
MVVAVAAQSHMVVVVAAEARPRIVAAVAVGLVHHMPTAAVVGAEEHRTSVVAVIAVGCSNDLGLNSAHSVNLEGMIAAVG